MYIFEVKLGKSKDHFNCKQMRREVFNIGDKVTDGKYSLIVIERLNPELDYFYDDTFYIVRTSGYDKIYRWGSELSLIKPSIFYRFFKFIYEKIHI